jgi:hypothetical protein
MPNYKAIMPRSKKRSTRRKFNDNQVRVQNFFKHVIVPHAKKHYYDNGKKPTWALAVKAAWNDKRAEYEDHRSKKERSSRASWFNE